MRILTQFFVVCLLFVAASTTLAAQGVTTASMFGKLTDKETGDPLIGATVQAVHTPSGTSYGNITDVDGFFRVPGMRVGGPYTITATYVGYEPVVKDGVYLQLGQAFQFSPEMGTDAVELIGVEVVSSRGDIFNGQATGQATNVGEEAIQALPAVSRSIGDFTRLTPQSTTREGNDGLELSFGGINNRYNAIFIDGAVSNDVFGLAGSGTNGGQTGVSPISVDAIESFQINLAPYDVRQGGFGGASINAVTRSGSNNFEGSAYGFFRNQNLVRGDLDGAEFSDFNAYTAGFRIGGPLIEDKLFFFFNYERQDETTPQPFDSNDYEGESSISQINALADQLRNQFGYDPGTFIENESFLVSDKINFKLDYNLNDANKLTLSLGYTGADNLEGVQSNARNINFLGSSERFNAKTYRGTLELNTLIGSTMSNNLIIGATLQRDDRDPNGDPFPFVRIQDGSGRIQFGSERFSTANLLNQDIITITNNFEIFKGKHTYTIGGNIEFYSTENLFIPSNFGLYDYDNLAQFTSGMPATEFERIFSLRDNITGDGSAAAAIFDAGQAGLYFQDRIQFSDRFNFTAGIRFDLPWYGETPTNEQFNEEVLPIIEEVYDLQGARSGDFIDARILFSPRIGFNWDIEGNQRTQMRGGLGIFTSRAPLVWVGGAYNNNGVNTGFFGDTDVPFTPQFDQQLPGDIDLNNVPTGGNVDLFAQDFRLPQFFKASLAVDRKLPGGFIGTLDVLYNKVLQNVAYQNVNINPATDNLEGADNRPFFGNGGRDLVGLQDAGLTQYGRVILGYNTNRGYSYNLTASLQRPFKNGLFVQASYSFGDSYSVFDGTSSQNSSQWRGLHNVWGRNVDQRVMRSDFAAGSRFLGVVSKRWAYGAGKNWATTLTLTSETFQASPYSLLVGNPNFNGRTDSRERNLAFLPERASDLVFVDDNGVSAGVQEAEFQRFLNAYNEGETQLGGRYAERNERFGPWNTIVDIKIAQDIPISGNNRLQITFEALNFTNLITKDWGRRFFIPSNFEVLQFEGFQDGTLVPTYSFDVDQIDENGLIDFDNFFDDSGLFSSRFQGQIGIRYIFE
ncbi:MAG: carboxypeptidase regulatory-like domain-containing protein [Bacteroidota bacterium]